MVFHGQHRMPHVVGDLRELDGDPVLVGDLGNDRAVRGEDLRPKSQLGNRQRFSALELLTEQLGGLAESANRGEKAGSHESGRRQDHERDGQPVEHELDGEVVVRVLRPRRGPVVLDRHPVPQVDHHVPLVVGEHQDQHGPR